MLFRSKTFQGMKLMISILAMAGILAGPVAALGQTSTQPTVLVAPLDGELILDTVQQDRSKAVYSGSAAVKQGWTVKAQ